jgi:uncharacterized protein YegP (UPF0339 family)
VAKYEIYEDSAGAWRWRLVADNGEIVAQSESYPSKDHAQRGADDAANVSEEASSDE